MSAAAHLPLAVVVVANRGYGEIRDEMLARALGVALAADRPTVLHARCA